MVEWLVVTAEHPRAGRGVRGYALTWFLQTYFGRRSVAVRHLRHVRGSNVPRTRTLFLGLPTTLTGDEIRSLAARSGARCIVPFDYLDRHELAWTEDQETALRPMTDRYFKPWFEPAWRYGLRMGMLPLRTHPQLYLSIGWNRWRGRHRRPARRRYDVAFLGRPNKTAVLDGDGTIRQLDQRVDWLRAVRAEFPELTIGGGLTGWNRPSFQEREARDPSLRSACYKRDSVNFLTYWRILSNARVLLSPGGNAPWTYRHYESLYAGGVVVTIDFRHRDMLVPLPRANMVHVPDGEAVVPAVRQALELSESRPELAEENYAHLEQYLHWGSYAPTRRALIERFLAQLDEA